MKKFLAPWKKSYNQPRQHIKKQRHYFANKGPSSQSYGFSSSHVWMWESDYKESWVLKNWCFWTVWLEKTLESPLDCKETKPVNPKENQSWIFIGRTDAEAETPILWSPDAKSWLIRKRPRCCERLKAGGEGDDKGWDGWMASLTQWTWVWASSWSGEGQGSLVCCSPRGHKELDTTEWLSSNKLNLITRGKSGKENFNSITNTPFALGNTNCSSVVNRCFTRKQGDLPEKVNQDWFVQYLLL